MRKTLIALFASLSMFSMIANAESSPNFNPQQVNDIENIMHQYFLKNPEILIEVSDILKKKQEEKQQKEMQASIERNKDQLFMSNTTPSIGAKNPNTYIVEFYDFQCGHCKVQSKIMNQLLTKHKDVRLVLKDFPIFGGTSLFTAKAAISAYKINKAAYVTFHDMLMDYNKGLNKKAVLKLAQEAGYQTATIQKMIASQEISDQMDKEIDLAIKLNIRATPFIIVANADLSKIKTVPGTARLEQLEAVIASVQ